MIAASENPAAIEFRISSAREIQVSKLDMASLIPVRSWGLPAEKLAYLITISRWGAVERPVNARLGFDAIACWRPARM